MLIRFAKSAGPLVKERCEKNENGKHVSGVMRLVLQFAVRTIAAGCESDTRVDSKPTGHFSAYLSRHRDRADNEGDKLSTPQRRHKN